MQLQIAAAIWWIQLRSWVLVVDNDDDDDDDDDGDDDGGQGSDTRVRTQKNPMGKKTRWVFFGYTHLKKSTLKNPHFYFNLILVYTLYATNNAIFYWFKAFKALGYWVFVLFYLFSCLSKKTQ